MEYQKKNQRRKDRKQRLREWRQQLREKHERLREERHQQWLMARETTDHMNNNLIKASQRIKQEQQQIGDIYKQLQAMRAAIVISSDDEKIHGDVKVEIEDVVENNKADTPTSPIKCDRGPGNVELGLCECGKPYHRDF